MRFAIVVIGIGCGRSVMTESDDGPTQQTGLSLESSVTAVWANSGEDKVTQDELRASQAATNLVNSVWDGNRINIFGARNEVVSFNVILEAAGSSANQISVAFKRLEGPEGALITAAPTSGNGVFDWTQRPIELFYVRYLAIKGLSRLSYDTYDERHIPARLRRPNGQGTWLDRPDHDKFYPDIAVPLELVPSFTIAANTNQSIWADIYIPKGSPPGLYQGQLEVQQGGTLLQSVPVQLNVYGFTLPDVPSAKTMLYFSSPNINRRYLGSTWVEPNSAAGAKARAIRDRHFLMAHRHRVSLIGDSSDDCSPPVQDRPCPEWEARLDGSLFSAANGYAGPGVNVGNNVYSIGTYGNWDWKAGGQSAMHQHTDAWETWFAQHTPTTERFLYLIDESSDTAQIETWASWMASNPGPGGQLKSLATIPLTLAAAQTPSLDIPTSSLGVGISEQWQPLVDLYTQDPRKRFFMYNGSRPATGSTATEDDGVTLRERAWAHYKLKVNRWFFWETTYYNDFQGGSGEMNVFESAHTFGGAGSIDAVLGETGWNHSNGDGVLFYPGTDLLFPVDSYGVDGPFASLRLKHWRRGLQDVDYLTLAAATNPSAVQSLVTSMVPKAAWEYGVSNVSDPTYVLSDISWSTDPNVWEAARAQLAAIIVDTTEPPNQAPLASIATTINGLGVSADGSASADPDGSITTYTWDFGDGSGAQGMVVSHQYPSAGSYTITLTVTDNGGASGASQVNVTLGEPPTGTTTTRYEESDPLVLREPVPYNWNTGTDSRASANTYMASATAGVRLSFPFNGTGVSVIGIQDSCSGQAEIEIDGSVQALDAYRANGGWQQTLYSNTTLPNGSHTLTLTVLGAKQSASCGAWIYIDALDIISASSRVEENDPTITRGPTPYGWGSGTDSRASANAYMASATAGVTLSLPFNGTGISLIGTQDSCSGQAEVEIDGSSQTFDAYRANGGWQQTLYSLTGLPAGTHALTLTVLGTQRPSSCGAWLYVDAFDVQR